MFTEAITATSFTTDFVDGLMNNIRGDSFYDCGKRDDTFLSTLRALLYKKVPDGESIDLKFLGSNNFSASLSDDCIKSSLVSIISSNDMMNKGRINIVYIRNNTIADCGIILDKIDGFSSEVLPNYKKINRITEFYIKNFKVYCYVNEENKNVILFTEPLNAQRVHYLQCSIIAFMPWFFSKEIGVSDLEMNLIKTLNKKVASDYIKAIDDIYAQYDFRTEKIRKYLNNFEHKIEERKLEEYNRSLLNVLRDLENLRNSISSKLSKKREYDMMIGALTEHLASNTEEESEVMKYFLRNKNIHLEEVSGDKVTFVATGYLRYYDEDEVERMIKNSSSLLYRHSDKIPASEMKKLMNALFIDRTLKMRFCAKYYFEISSNADCVAHTGYSGEYATYMPNPHIQHYSCIGNYVETIPELAQKGDYIGVIEQCIASCCSLNFNDPTVMQRFVKIICNGSDYEDYTNTNCIELPDGTVTDAFGALKYLKSLEENDG